ncbi:MAG: outer membrane lipoprotein-sorting protein [Verrucomicrobiota bacterium]
MNRPHRLLTILITGLLLVLTRTDSPAADAASGPREQADGQTLAREVRSLQPASTTTNRATLEIRNAAGKRHRVPVVIETLAPTPGTDRWSTRYRTGSADTATGETLEIVHRVDAAPEYRLEGVPGTAASPIAATGTGRPFAGSDFSLADLGLEFLHWPQQRLIPAPKDNPHMVKGRSCRVLESRNPTGTPYSRVVSWIDLEFRGLIQADAYDARGQLLKQFSVGSFKKVDGAWRLKDMEIIDEQRGTKTRLEFELTVPQ